jgi:hypothetical protein
MPTYFGDQVNWGAAQVIDLQESTYEKHIHLSPTQPLSYGPGTISGNLVFEGSEPASKEGIHVILSNNENQPLAFRPSDDLGNFTFNYLPLGTYQVRADFTGHPSEPIAVILTSADPDYNNMELVVDEQATYDIDDNFPDHIVSARLYPNPASDRINLEILSDERSTGIISVFDITGKHLLSETSYFRQGRQVHTLDVSALPQGVYLVKVKMKNSSIPLIRKFIR